ncbi:glycosyltransferase [Pectobacterium versatile]|uniref:glycosyltransferase n=1 Tax=Pectobacterium versatile TaxID=2488639 RepID=UPI001B35CCAC|nr:glycosyltransferase [Pectobacterium versatile]
MNVTAITVTYGNRAKFVKEVIFSCLSQNIKKIIIIDNGSPNENYEYLKKLQSQFPSEIGVYHSHKNEGSALGFKKGILLAEEQSDKDSWFLLLDDDNSLVDGALDALKNAIELNDSHERNAYLCLRKDRSQYLNFLASEDDTDILGVTDSFLGFSIWQSIKRKFDKKKYSSSVIPNKIVNCPCGPYGGLFFHRKIVDAIGYPNEKLFLYSDDTEYTLRLRQNDINLWLVSSALISDIDESWSNIKSKKKISSPLFETQDYKIYYSIRNRIYLERKYLVNNYFIYVCNIISSLTILTVKALLCSSFRKLILIYKSIYDGFWFKI